MRNLHRILLASLAASSLVAQKNTDPPAPSVFVNKHLPKWVRFGGEHRTRFEGYANGGFAPESSDSYWLSRSRLSLTLLPTSWFRVTAEGQDSRVMGKQPGQPPYENVWDFRLAYAELGDLDKRPFGLRVGRQELVFGENRVIGGADWSNATRSFDGIRATVRFSGNRIDIFAASVVANVNDTWDHHQQGNNFHGIYGDLTRLIPHAVLQPYVLWRLQPRVRNEAGKIANVDEKIPGFRFVGTLPWGFDYNIEMAKEVGSVGSDRIAAWLGHWLLARSWKNARFSPRFWGEYNYVSGDANPTDGVRETFDPLYPTLHNKFGFADQFSGRNLKHIKGGVETKLPHGVATVLQFNDFHLASKVDWLYSGSGAQIGRSLTGAFGSHVADEVDLTATWKMRGPVQGLAGVGYVWPGEFLKHTTAAKPYLYPFIMFTYRL